MEPIRFPQYLNSPMQVLWAEADTFAIFFIGFCLFLVFGKIFLLPMILCPYGFSRAKRNYARGFLKHCLFYMGITEFKGYPSYLEKNFSE